jgi:hypothetical protein
MHFGIIHQNIRCLTNKVYQLEAILQSVELMHVVCLTEHWKKSEELTSIKIMNYGLSSSYCRKNKIHGGASIHVHNTVKAAELSSLVNLSIEMVIEIAAIEIVEYKLVIICIYRPPSGDVTVFLDRLSTLLNLINDEHVNNNTLVVGDFNINLLKESQNKNKLLDLMRCSNLMPIVTCPTRSHNSSESCLDHAYSDIEKIEFAPLKTGISDHDGQVMTIEFQRKNGKNCVQMTDIRRITPHKFNCFWESLDLFNWEKIVNSGREPDQILDSVVNVFIHTYQQAFPKCKQSIRKVSKKWVTQEIISKKSILDDVKRLCNVFQGNISLNNFKDQFEELYNKLIICKRSEHFKCEISKATNKAKAIWNVIRHETNASHGNITSIDTANPSLLAEEISNFFINSVKYAQKRPDIELSMRLLGAYVPKVDNCAVLEPFTIGEIYKLIKQIKPKCTKDIYEIPTDFLSKLPPSFIDILCHTMNMCLENGSYPETLKKIKVVPIYKGKGLKSDYKNYRPISIIPALSKIFELGIGKRLMKYLTGQELLAKEQYAYQSHKSTIDATRALLKEVFDKLEMGCRVAVILCDLSKAFDLVDHKLIIHKLHHYGIRDNFLDLFRSFLKNRVQVCEISANSKKGQSNSHTLDDISVPQGSVIGNYLFIILVNDLASSTRYGKLIAYADDSAFVVSGSNYMELQSRINQLLLDLNTWFTANGMLLNLEKTNVMQIGLRSLPTIPNLNNAQVPFVKNAKYLGFTLDSRLTWENHIDNLCKKLGKVCYAISRLTKMLDDHSVRMSYFAYFQSLVTYGIDMWGQAADRQRIFILQKKAIRIMARVPWDTPARDLFRKMKILTVPSLYILEISKIVRKSLNQFKTRGPNQRYAGNLLINIHKIKKSEQCYWFVGPKIYNRLPRNVKEAKMSESAFVNQLKDFLTEKAYYSLDEFLNEFLTNN